MFLDEPTRVTRNYKSIRGLVGDKIFKKGDRLEPYYVAAFAAYRLEFLFRNHYLDSSYKAARYHVLMAFRYLVNNQPWPHMNSHEMQRRCIEYMNALWETERSDALMRDAAQAVREVVLPAEFERDNIRTEPVKEALLERLAAGHQ